MIKRRSNIVLKTKDEIVSIKKSCVIVEKILKKLSGIIKPGITTKDIEKFASRVFEHTGCESSLKNYRGFPGYISTSVNSVAAHGIPDDRKLAAGDILTVDITVKYQGWHGDGAWTYIVPGKSEKDIQEELRLRQAAWRVCMAGIGAAVAGKRMGDVGAAIHQELDICKCSLIEEMAGHGIGRKMHEDPVVYHHGSAGVGQPLVPGMVLTIEPVITFGTNETITLGDSWSLATSDSMKTAQFEHTIAITAKDTRILTLGDIVVQKFLGQSPPY